MPDTLLPFAVLRAGPLEKTGQPGYGDCEGRGVVVHSAEGSVAAAFAVLDGPKRASWHCTVAKDGTFFQHYPLERITWHAGADANPHYIGIECEGVAGEPLTSDQLQTLAGVIRLIRNARSWPVAERHVTLFEHNEFMPTSCPSGRIPWDELIPMIEITRPPSKEAQLRGLIAAAFVLSIDHPLTDLGPADRDAVAYVAGKL